MRFTKESVIAGLKSLSGSNDYTVAVDFLNSDGVTMFDQEIAGKKAGERLVHPKDIIKTWRARCEHAQTTDTPLYGCIEFVKKLSSLPEATELVNIVFTNRRSTGLFWFDEKSTEAIGFVIANRPVFPETA